MSDNISLLPQLSQGVQEVTGFMEPARSVLNISDLPVGNHVINCAAELDDINLQIITASINVTIEAVLFENITISPMASPVIIEQNGNGPMVTLICSLASNLLPTITWTQDGTIVQGTPAIEGDDGESIVQSELLVNTTGFVGQVDFVCNASLEEAVLNENLVAMATITARSKCVPMKSQNVLLIVMFSNQN